MGFAEGFSPESIDTLSKSAKALSYQGYVIVFCDEEKKSQVYVNSRICVITPAEFISLNEEAEEFMEIFPIKELKKIDYLKLILFNKEIYQRIKKISEN